MFKFFKRAFDVFFSFLFLLISSPMLIIFILLIILIDFHSPFFIQERSGLNGRKIKIIKLQTMKVFDGKLKITKLGRLLRLTKIDELPQLFNVLIGNMSFIGPRPLYLEFNHYLKKAHKLRLTVKPGITGLAQIRVKDSTNWNKKFNYDVIYVRKNNFKLDFYIFFETIFMIIKSILFTKHRPNEIIDYKSSFNESYK